MIRKEKYEPANFQKAVPFGLGLEWFIDLNCDMGEGIGNDAEIIPFISSANIACGFHAGNEDIMKKTVELCIKNNVAIGAHPSFPDKENFGRTEMLHFATCHFSGFVAHLHIEPKGDQRTFVKP